MNTRGTWHKGNIPEATGKKDALFLITDAAKNPSDTPSNETFEKG